MNKFIDTSILNDKKFIKQIKINFIIFLLVSVVLFFISVSNSRKYQDVRDICINGTVINLKKVRGNLHFELNNEEEKFKMGYALNHELSPSSLIEFIQEGDSILKSKNSNKLTIIRNNERYYFLLGETIGQSED